MRVRFRVGVGLLLMGPAIATTGCSDQTVSAPPKSRPNLLLVTLDTTRADHLGCYGYARPTSPNLDRLAAEGVRFDAAISQSALTPVSHASILTGLNPYHHGLRVIYAASAYRLPESVPTLATILGGAGWKTGAFVSAFTVSEYYGFHHGFERFDNGMGGPPTGEMFRKNADGFWVWDLNRNQRRSDRTTDQALGWLGQTSSPFFLWVHYWDPHDDALVPPQEVIDRFPPAGPSPEQRSIALYDAEIAFVDQQLGRLLDQLQASKRDRDTIVVVLADHGEGLGDHGWWFHRILYQEQIHVPLIVRIPWGPKGRTVSQVVRSVDVLPSVLEALGVTPARAVDGASFLRLMNGEKESRARVAYSDSLNLYDLDAFMMKVRPNDDLVFSAVDYPWKLLYRQRRPAESELYDLASDPREAHNLYAEKAPQAAPLAAFVKASGGFVDAPFGAGAQDPETIERLRSLGYVGGGPVKGGPPLPGTSPPK